MIVIIITITGNNSTVNNVHSSGIKNVNNEINDIRHKQAETNTQTVVLDQNCYAG